MNTSLPVTTEFTLLVGEGDFSFAASYLQKAKQSPNENIFASCLNYDSVTSKQEANVKFIQCNGGSVLTDVDATKLENHSIISKLLFSKIIFNFPHVAKKMNIRDNRKLVRDFLKSAETVLKQDGRIYVTLCKGQGGTDGETVTRAWGNTWQIVSLSSYANLMLCNIEFFNSSYFDAYECTGFRGLSKSFDIDGAITHIFCRGQPVLYEDFNFQNIQSERTFVTFTTDIQRLYKISSDWLDRPYTRIICALDDDAKSKFTSLDCIFVDDLHICKRISSICYEQSLCDNESKQLPNFCNECVTTLLAIFLYNVQNNNTVTSVICSICCLNNFNISKLPFTHMVSYFSSCEENIMTSLSTVFDVLKDPNLCKKTVSSWFSLKSSSTAISNLIEKSQFSSFSKNCEVKECLPIHATYSKIKSNGFNFYSDIEISVIYDKESKNDNPKEYLEIGHILKFNYNMECYIAALLNLDLIAELKFHVIDYRLLLLDEAFFSMQICQEALIPVFRSPSLYPPSYIHDVSFWVDEDFMEIDFFTVIKNTLGFLVKSVKLIDEFQDITTKKQSKCYRFVYQSSNNVLSKTSTSMIHTGIMRKVIENSLNVQLR